MTVMRKVMIFIDGANIFRTARQFRSNFQVDYMKLITTLVGSRTLIRAYFFGAEKVPPTQQQVNFYEKLQIQGITVIKRPLRRRGNTFIEKGIDVALATKMLILGFRNAYDVAILVSGDSDYVDAIKEIKDRGKIVEVAAFRCGFARELRLTADRAIILDNLAGSIEHT